MASSPKQVFLQYIAKLDLMIYSETLRSMVLLAESAEESAFIDIPNWWPVSTAKTQTNEDIASFIQESAMGVRDEDAEDISVTLNGLPGTNLSSVERMKILQHCLHNIIEGWKKDPQGTRPEVSRQRPAKGVIAYPLSGSYGKKIADWIGLPTFYPQNLIPRWQRMAKSRCPELVVTLTNTGHVTHAHIDNPCLQADVYHVFGRKLWFIWADCDHNTQQMMRFSGDYDDIDVEWCYENLIGLKLVFTRPGGAYFNPHIHMPPACWHSVVSFSPSMAVSGYVCDTSSYKRCMDNMMVHENHYKNARNIAPDLNRTLMYEINRARSSWSDYMESEPDASGILDTHNFP